MYSYYIYNHGCTHTYIIIYVIKEHEGSSGSNLFLFFLYSPNVRSGGSGIAAHCCEVYFQTKSIDLHSLLFTHFHIYIADYYAYYNVQQLIYKKDTLPYIWLFFCLRVFWTCIGKFYQNILKVFCIWFTLFAVIEFEDEKYSDWLVHTTFHILKDIGAYMRLAVNQ